MIKKIWGIPIFRDMLWFFILLLTARGTWLLITKIEPITTLFNIKEIQVITSSLYVKAIALYFNLINEPIFVSNNLTINFTDFNYDFTIGADCSALGHYFYYIILIVCIPTIKSNFARLTILVVGILTIFFFRALVLFIQIRLFLSDNAFLETFHKNSIYISMTIFFLLWFVAIEIKNKKLPSEVKPD